MSETEIINEEPIDSGPPSSSEDKFFGVTTQINTCLLYTSDAADE